MAEHPLVSAARSLRPEINASAEFIENNRKIPAELMTQDFSLWLCQKSLVGLK